MKIKLILFLALVSFTSSAQDLKLPKPAKPLSATEFLAGIRDTSLSISEREEIIYRKVLAGHVPDFYRKLVQVTDTVSITDKTYVIRYYVLPDFLAIGTNEDHFYCPMTASLAQRIAKKLKCSLPTRKISDVIYKNALVKMIPEPIPPSKEMITVPVFEKHSGLVKVQRNQTIQSFPLGNLVAGNKKDVVISNRIVNDKGLPRVVIYGWHQPGGKPIQPLYNGHTPDWADYSHGIRLVQNKVWVNGKKTTLQKVLASGLHPLISDEGPITNPFYPVQ